MAIEADSAVVEMSAGERAAGLNHVALLRAKFWADDSEKDVARFFDEMNDVTDINYSANKRALSAIFYLANIKKDRHDVAYSELTTDEKGALIRAMNHFRAVVSLFPKRLSLPN